MRLLLTVYFEFIRKNSINIKTINSIIWGTLSSPFKLKDGSKSDIRCVLVKCGLLARIEGAILAIRLVNEFGQQS